MPTLSIISCKIMQDEIIWLLTNDYEINKIVIVENENISEFTEKLNEQHTSYEITPFEKIPNILENVDANKLTVIVNLWNLDSMPYQRF